MQSGILTTETQSSRSRSIIITRRPLRLGGEKSELFVSFVHFVVRLFFTAAAVERRYFFGHFPAELLSH
jgi:hypothetical protein